MAQIKHSKFIHIDTTLLGEADVAVGGGGGGGGDQSDNGEGDQLRVPAKGGGGFQDVHQGDISESEIFRGGEKAAQLLQLHGLSASPQPGLERFRFTTH